MFGLPFACASLFNRSLCSAKQLSTVIKIMCFQVNRSLILVASSTLLSIWFVFGAVNQELGMDRATSAKVVEVAKGLVVPFISLNQIICKIYSQNPLTNSIIVIFNAGCYLGGWASYMASGSYPGLKGAA
jgi:hypothetical protein